MRHLSMRPSECYHLIASWWRSPGLIFSSSPANRAWIWRVIEVEMGLKPSRGCARLFMRPARENRLAIPKIGKSFRHKSSPAAFIARKESFSKHFLSASASRLSPLIDIYDVSHTRTFIILYDYDDDSFFIATSYLSSFHSPSRLEYRFFGREYA